MLLPQGRRVKNQWLAGDAYGKPSACALVEAAELEPSRQAAASLDTVPP